MSAIGLLVTAFIITIASLVIGIVIGINLQDHTE